MSEGKSLHRSSDDRMLAGVSGGLADYFNLDPVLFRLLFVLLTLTTGIWAGVLTYAVLWIVMPEEVPSEES